MGNQIEPRMPPGQWCDCYFCQTLEVETNNHRQLQPPRGRGGDAGGSGNSGMGMGGEIVAGKADFESRYEFVKTLGDGGQGGVYKYRRRADGAMVAVKEFGCLTAKYVRDGVCVCTGSTTQASSSITPHNHNDKNEQGVAHPLLRAAPAHLRAGGPHALREPPRALHEARHGDHGHLPAGKFSGFGLGCDVCIWSGIDRVAPLILSPS